MVCPYTCSASVTQEMKISEAPFLRPKKNMLIKNEKLAILFVCRLFVTPFWMIGFSPGQNWSSKTLRFKNGLSWKLVGFFSSKMGPIFVLNVATMHGGAVAHRQNHQFGTTSLADLEKWLLILIDLFYIIKCVGFHTKLIFLCRSFLLSWFSKLFHSKITWFVDVVIFDHLPVSVNLICLSVSKHLSLDSWFLPALSSCTVIDLRNGRVVFSKTEISHFCLAMVFFISQSEGKTKVSVELVLPWSRLWFFTMRKPGFPKFPAFRPSLPLEFALHFF